MSGDISKDPRNSKSQRIKVMPSSGYQPIPTERKNFKSKSGRSRSKTPEQTARNPPPHYQFSSDDSEIMFDQDLNREFYENNRPDKRGRLDKKEKFRRSKSRERSLENNLSQQSISQRSPHIEDEYIIDEGGSYPSNKRWTAQRSLGHHRSATLPVMHQSQTEFNDADMNELMELRVRAEQMDKTLRWWSDCTANWREKWTKVRTERNRAREELKRTKSELDDASKELVVLRQQRGLLVEENTMLRHDSKSNDLYEENSAQSNETPRGSESRNNSNKSFGFDRNKQGKNFAQSNHNNGQLDEDRLSQKVLGLQLKVDESAKTIQAERDSKLNLNKTIEQLEQEISTLKQKYTEVKDARQEALKQLSRIQESHRSEVLRLNQNLEEELQNRSIMEKKIHDLREEIERLQEENTSEWGRRERLETEKLQLERDNKRLKSVTDEMKASLDRKRKSVAEDRDNELRQVQAEAHDLKEELNDLRRQSNRDQKVLEDKQEELAHSRRRAEQHEAEVRQLRTRVEEIKKQQTMTEDELDNSQNQSRKLTRVVEEKEEEIEKLHLHVDQLQTRIRRDPTSTTWSKPATYNRRDVDAEHSSSESSCEI